MSVETWDEIRTAFHVARLGTVSGAAEVLGVHHATVIRHIDALEHRLGTKLFQRHARGYTATEAGQDLMRVAQTTADQFTQLSGRIRGQGQEVTGELIVTAVPGFSQRLAPVLVRFQASHPGLIVRFLSDERLFRLEYGEAHIALRAGTLPDQPDNVVQLLYRSPWSLYCSKQYGEANGVPKTEAELAEHRFVSTDQDRSKAPFSRWLWHTVPADRIVFRVTETAAIGDAVRAGAGLGFLQADQAELDPDLIQIFPPRDEWAAPIWIVTHVDLHRTTKVQAFLTFLKDEAKSWNRQEPQNPI